MAKINDLKLGRKIADAEDEQNLTAAAFVGSEDTAEEEEKGILLAGICERFLAWLVDFLPFFLLAVFLFNFMQAAGFGISKLAADAFAALLFVLYTAVFSCGGRATLGKYLFRIRVVRNSDEKPQPLGFKKALVRGIGYLFSIPFFSLGFLIALFTPRHRALHDYMAGSMVVSLKERSSWGDGIILAVTWAMIAFMIGNFVNKRIFQLSDKEKQQIVKAHDSIKKIAILEEAYCQKNYTYTNNADNLFKLAGNIHAIKTELTLVLDTTSLQIVSNGRSYTIRAKAKNWRHTQVEVKSKNYCKSRADMLPPVNAAF